MSTIYLDQSVSNQINLNQYIPIYNHMHIITIKYINQLAIKSIHTINIQSYEYNYNKIHSESHKFNQLHTILKQFHLIEHGQTYT